MSTYEISKSSLLSLKAEILRKQEELTKIKQINELKLGNIKKNSPLFHKPRTEENKNPDSLEDDQDENLLEKSRAALEAKAKLYDKLVEDSAKHSDVPTEERPRYLVQFDKKVNIDKSYRNLPANDNDNDSEVLEDTFEEEYDSANNPDDEWVEYKDCLGRTRMCMKKDLPHLKLDDEKLKKEVESRLRLSEEGQDKETELNKSKDDDSKPDENDEPTIDKRRELLRQQWEKEEDRLRDKSDIHYQDLLFDEARTHGVSYYAFSKDEEERAKQQEALRKLRQETEEQQKKSHDLKMLREKQMAARLKTARNRKRARMGLPPEEDDPVPETQEPEKPPENEESEKVSEPSSEELAREEARRRHVRPWDIGKEGVKEFYVYTQEEWVEKKRDDRPAEFAPPSTYGREFTSNVSYNRFREPQNQSLYDTTLKNDAQLPLNRNSHKLRKLNLYKYNEYEHIEQPELREPVPIRDECETGQHNIFENDRGNKSFATRGKGVEIAPPSTYEYYGPSDVKKKKPLENKNLELEESINAGLQFLRNEFEKKKSARQPEDMFLM